MYTYLYINDLNSFFYCLIRHLFLCTKSFIAHLESCTRLNTAVLTELILLFNCCCQFCDSVALLPILYESGRTPSILCLYQLMTALPQLISRVCHSHAGVFREISNIIATLMATYPQQVMWHMVAVSKVCGIELL